ncbi:MAG TPA: hypothetical protein VGR86_06960 [Steroidobacteraceae bacterium]|nr:hypothetical protein [Steroidobacteraceae bacterium]
MRRYFPLAALLTLAGCYNMPGGDVTADGSGANTVNGSIHVPAGTRSGAVATVNGSIRIDDNATVGSAGTVNGSVALGAHATADTVGTVNGSITLGEGAHVVRDVTTVNGSMTLKNGADVGGPLSNVNGRIALNEAHVAGGLRTVDGDIDVGGGSHVEGGIIVRHGGGGWFNFGTRKPRIVIGPGAVVQGDLRFERAVELYVSDSATTGPITGATAVRFAGASPPQG